MVMPSIDLFHPVMLPEMEAAALEVLRSGQIASGPKVQALEAAFGRLIQRDHLVAVNDMSSAVMLALHLAGVGPGDSVATLAFSCLSSNAPMARLGAHAVWIDIDPATMSMSVDDLAAKMTPDVKAVMVYHVAGYPADIGRIADLCRDRGVVLIEDCNNALGATTAAGPLGVHGDYAIYSLYPNRQVNGIEGGLLATPDVETAGRAIQLRRFGIDGRSFRDARGEINPESDVAEIGWSAALSHLNAAVALSQLPTLDSRLTRTRSVGLKLASALAATDNVRPVEPVRGGSAAYWGFLALSEHRDALLAHLKLHGIKASVLHQRNDWYSGFGLARAELPGTATVMEQLIALPSGWWLSDAQLDELVAQVVRFRPSH